MADFEEAFAEIAQKAITEAEAVDCSFEDFIYGLGVIIEQLRDRKRSAEDEHDFDGDDDDDLSDDGDEDLEED